MFGHLFPIELVPAMKFSFFETIVCCMVLFPSETIVGCMLRW
jgi:hypothetical protein